MRVAIVLVFGVVVAACGGGGEAATTVPIQDTSAQAASTVATTEAETPTTSAATTTPGVGSSSSEECLVGEWELDSEAFITAIVEAFGDSEELAGATFEFVSGSNITQLAADGTFWNDRDEWSFRITSPDGAVRTTIDGIDMGTYTVSGDQITISDVDQAAVVKLQAEVDGELVDIPFGSTGLVQTDVWVGTATYSCSGDVLTLMTDEGVTSMLHRVG